MIEWVPDAASLAEWSDADLLAAYERTGGEGAEAEALLAEIERRELDV